MTDTRPCWDRYYLGIAEAVSRRADCSRRQVGAVIVQKHSIVGTGYNGAPPGHRGCLAGGCARAGSGAQPGEGYEQSGCHAIHAEVNAIIRAGRERTIGGHLYVTSEPCVMCWPLIEAAGLMEVVWPEQETNKIRRRRWL